MNVQALTNKQTSGLAIYLLGTPRVERDGQPLPTPRGHKVWGLLAYLVCRDSPVSRKHLAGLMFEDAEDPLAALRWNLSELRRLVGNAELRGDQLMLALEPATYIDVKVVAVGAWAQALGVAGLDHELLEGMSFPVSPAFEIWLATERRHLQATAEAVLREASLARMATGALVEATKLASRLVRRNPLDENYQALLVRSLAASGDGVGAARQAAACRELFLRELGVLPGAAIDAAMRTVTDSPTARPATGRAAVIAQLEAGEAAIGAGVLDAGLQCLRRAIVEADAVGEETLRVRTRVALGGALVHAARGRDEEGAMALHEALAIGQDAAALRELAYVEFLGGRYERAFGWLQKATPLAHEDSAEQARIATVQGAALSDTAHYAAAISTLREAERLAGFAGDSKQISYALSMLGRAFLLQGDFEAAREVLDRSVMLAQQGWTAFVPWPQSLRAEVDLACGDLVAASERFEHAFALGCQIGDPCWQGIAGRGLGRVAIARGEPQRALEILVDAVERCLVLPDAYLWGKGHALDALCDLAVTQARSQASAWINELQNLAARSGMRELTVRAYLHRQTLGDNASGAAARLLAQQIDNPALHVLVESGLRRPERDSAEREAVHPFKPAMPLPAGRRA
ncbi:BTAD domain-containing putative transcriptional regulator [Polaromonas sp.]|uniref:BTAD domain-containing putative transcriptional regulator n=1 Tax=Polaromonas sp. TaxID=1869339 RepID=UPI003265FAD9